MKVLNFSLAANNWKTYRTVENHILRIKKETRKTLQFPFNMESTILFIGYLLNNRKVSGSTLDQYITGLRMIHMINGHFNTYLRPSIVTQIITGVKNMDNTLGRRLLKETRLPMTPELMRVLRTELKKSGMSRQKARLTWVVATWAWSGAFRIHETLSRKQKEFDPTCTLLAKDVTSTKLAIHGTTHDCIRIHLKSPKEEKLSNGVYIDLFPVIGSAGWMCPVQAFIKWRNEKTTKTSPNLPMFRTRTGEAYTGNAFNNDLRKLLSGNVSTVNGKITSHSFQKDMSKLYLVSGLHECTCMGSLCGILFVHIQVYGCGYTCVCLGMFVLGCL